MRGRLARSHYVKADGPVRGAYVRVGSTNRRADPTQVEEIKRLVRGSTFDEEPLPGLSSEAIDFRAASECFAPVRKLRRSDLRTLQLTLRWMRGGGRGSRALPSPTRYAALHRT